MLGFLVFPLLFTFIGVCKLLNAFLILITIIFRDNETFCVIISRVF